MSAIQRKFDEARERQVKAHSDTPWKHWQVTIPFLGWEIIGANNQGIARLPGTRPEDEANARHICLCVNTHERLVEAMRGTLHDLTELRIMADGSCAEALELELLKNLIDGRINGVKSALSEIEKGEE